jgi:hypothetical protein
MTTNPKGFQRKMLGDENGPANIDKNLTGERIILMQRTDKDVIYGVYLRKDEAIRIAEIAISLGWM